MHFLRVCVDELFCSFLSANDCVVFVFSDLLHRDSEDVAKRDYVYYLAVAHTRLKVGKPFLFIGLYACFRNP